ncbi:amino acid dehydrogenase [Acidovorax sp. GW101-3H11]|uniref:FAD-dependent oxidoreductase n=1 Tax=Acidovorax sp. GW101-3H11 TaxID=1813946 RepID=UPI0007B532AF|nr:FAD-dependent oxidoreductase [Acidovorax sp. GW101-3H11]KZT17061.1 amino acid dehydrogenase [Acidovorax sp. GW101-3H11]
MKIAIVGAGIVGVTTAYELASDGHEVTVFEQRSAAAEEASFATAGLLAPHLLTPWAVPGFGHALRLMGPHATLRLSGGLSRANWAWLSRWRSATHASSAPAAALERLAQYSQSRLQALAQRHELDFEASQGRLVLLRTEQERAQLQPALQVLRDSGVALREVDADIARQIEPGLSPEAPLAGAIHLPDARAGNCRLFAQLLRQGTQGSGVHFAFNTRIDRIGTTPVGVVVQGESDLRRFDAVVLCAGTASAALLPALGMRLPMAAVYGYSVSAPLRESTHAPQASVVDAAQQISITRLGQRVRIAGGAELAGADAEHHAATLQRLYRTLNDWFPGGAQLSSGVQVWRGARPLLPDGAPVVGASGVPGLWLNTGHGAGGWALACGSARALADLMAQRVPEVPLDGLGMRPF